MINLMAQNINPWRRDWTTYQNKGSHRNLKTGHAYSGANPAVLEMWTAIRCYSTPLWLGVGQAKQQGWFPRKGSKGCAIMRPFRVEYNKKRDDGKELRDENGKPIKVGYTAFRYQKIFNVADLQGATEESHAELQDQIEIEMDAFKPESIYERLNTAEKVLGAWPVETTWQGDRAFYQTREDRITMPAKKLFQTMEGMYSTWAHEQVHSTGHESRLNRDMGPDTLVYAREELVAELGAFLICNKLQICSDELNHAAYLKHWIEVLQQRPDALRLALSDASKAAGLICKDLDQQVEVNM